MFEKQTYYHSFKYVVHNKIKDMNLHNKYAYNLSNLIDLV